MLPQAWFGISRSGSVAASCSFQAVSAADSMITVWTDLEERPSRLRSGSRAWAQCDDGEGGYGYSRRHRHTQSRRPWARRSALTQRRTQRRTQWRSFVCLSLTARRRRLRARHGASRRVHVCKTASLEAEAPPYRWGRVRAHGGIDGTSQVTSHSCTRRALVLDASGLAGEREGGLVWKVSPLPRHFPLPLPFPCHCRVGTWATCFTREVPDGCSVHLPKIYPGDRGDSRSCQIVLQ